MATFAPVPLRAADPRLPAEEHPGMLPHQLALLHRMTALEAGCDSIRVAGAEGEGVTHLLTSQVGVLADKAGSGKTFALLELMRSCPPPLRCASVSQLTAMSYVRLAAPREGGGGGGGGGGAEPPGGPRVLPITLLVVPHNIAAQWGKVAADFCADNGHEPFHLAVTRAAHVPAARDSLFALSEGERAAAAIRYILVSATQLQHVLDIMDQRAMRVDRFVVDEADSLQCPRLRRRDMACFYWFVTASPQNLLIHTSTDRFAAQHSDALVQFSGVEFCRRIASRWCCATTREFFAPTTRDLALFGRCVSATVVMSDNAFVDESFNVPPPLLYDVVCKTPLTQRILNGMVNRNVIDRLNAGDEAAAIDLVRPGNRGTESSVIHFAVVSLKENIAALQAQMHYMALRRYATDEDRERALDRTRALVREHEAKIEGITRRITETTTCPICYDAIASKTVVRCCSASFCFACITSWVYAGPGGGPVRDAAPVRPCPWCKEPLSPAQFLVCAPPAAPAAAPDTAAEEAPDLWEDAPLRCLADRRATKAGGKEENLRRIASELARGDAPVRMLVFTDNDEVMHSVQRALRASGVTFGFLKGNAGVINARIREFRDEGPGARALLVNYRYYGSGLDLSSATDMVLMHSVADEMYYQVVGRAQRPPRRSQLRIWNLVNDSVERGREA